MAKTTFNITFTTPAGVTIAEAMDLHARYNGYQEVLIDGSANPETKAEFSKMAIARKAAEEIANQRRIDALEAARIEDAAKAKILVD